jgi:integration host factor subunit alpha
MTLTKNQITDSIQENLDLSKTEAYDVVEEFLEIIKDTIEGGNSLMISGFGKFSVNEKKARKGRNPATNKEMILSERRVVTFKCSGQLRKTINPLN